MPVHLLTREALALYFSRLSSGGVVLFHISNCYLDLVPIIARLAVDAGARYHHLIAPAASDGHRVSLAEVVAIAKPGGDLAALVDDGWDRPRAGKELWTDDRSDSAGVIR